MSESVSESGSESGSESVIARCSVCAFCEHLKPVLFPLAFVLGAPLGSFPVGRGTLCPRSE